MLKPRELFVGPNGLRAVWRLMIFVAMIVLLYFPSTMVIGWATRKLHTEMFTPLDGLIVFGVVFATLLLVSGIMARIEGRSIADYGLPWRRAFCRQYWQGAAISIASLTVLLLVLHLTGVYSFGAPTLHGANIWKWGAIWTVPLFLAALLEDFFYRGYLLFTLSTGIGFWPAALV